MFAWNIIKTIFGFGGSSSSFTYNFSNDKQGKNKQQSSSKQNVKETPSSHKKVFSSDEGDYIDYKEV